MVGRREVGSFGRGVGVGSGGGVSGSRWRKGFSEVLIVEEVRERVFTLI